MMRVVKVFFVIVLTIGVTGTHVYARPSVQLRLDPDIRTIITGMGPEKIKITTLTNTSGVQFTWKMSGVGTFEEKDPNSGVLYIPPANLQQKSQTTITVVVTDKEQRTAENTVTFTLIPKPEFEREKTVEALLRDADRLFKRKRYLTPPEENAFMFYTTVLQLSPDHEYALERIREMMEFYKEKGDSYYEASSNSVRSKEYYERYLIIADYLKIEDIGDEITKRLRMLTLLEEARKMFNPDQFHSIPKSSDFEAYRNNAEGAVNHYRSVLEIKPENSYAQEKIREVIQITMKWGNYAYQQDWFTTPEGRSAFEYYRIILAIDPEHGEARERLHTILENYKKRGDKEYAKEKYEDAKKWYERYLVVVEYLFHELHVQGLETDYKNIQERVELLNTTLVKTLEENAQ